MRMRGVAVNIIDGLPLFFLSLSSSIPHQQWGLRRKQKKKGGEKERERAKMAAGMHWAPTHGTNSRYYIRYVVGSSKGGKALLSSEQQSEAEAAAVSIFFSMVEEEA